MEVPLVVLGGGSNVLAPDEPMEGLVLQLNRSCGELRVEGPAERGVVEVYVGAGVRSARLLRFSLENRLSGAEFLVGIPGTIGGAAIMNAGTPEGSLADILLWVDALNERGGHERVLRRDLRPEYRCMGLPVHWTVVGVCLGLKRAVGGHGQRSKLREDMKRRKSSQPLEWPSAGSIYKNPQEAPAGYLIEKAGLKGFSVGGACISPKHANWIVNLGGATSSDVRALMSHIEKRVLLEFGVCLQREILIL
jgi:UDP-N-acetylmuramate dehydrogenase